MPQEVDDFTIAVPELTDKGACDLKVYSGLDRLWQMIERYRTTAPILMSVVNNKARHVRVVCGEHHQAGDWQLKDETSAAAQPRGVEVEFPHTISVQMPGETF